MAAIASFADVPVIDQKLDAKGYEKRAPGIMHPWERRPGLFGVACALATAVLSVAVVCGHFLLTGTPPFDKQSPRQVAAATIAKQDTVLTGLSAVIGGTWAPVDATLRKCEDADQYKGWERAASIEVDVGADGSGAPPGTTSALIDAIHTRLGQYGYDAGFAAPPEERTLLIAEPERATPDDDRSIRVELDGEYTRIVMRGNGEVPGR